MSESREHLRPGQRAFVLIQRMLPTLWLSGLAHRVTRSQRVWLKRRLIERFMAHFGISLDDARLRSPDAYLSFNHFFTRALMPDARPVDTATDALVSPVDGAVSQAGAIQEGRLIQAKGIRYSAAELLGVDAVGLGAFLGGEFATLYLSPRDYHRIHMPTDGKLISMNFQPGRLFSVNPTTVAGIPRVFNRNERLSLLFETPVGPFALVLVGAIFVGSIETRWTGLVTPPHGQRAWHKRMDVPMEVAKGEEIGRFNMGSTVILLAGAGAVRWSDELRPQTPLRMGQRIGTIERH